MAKSQELIAFYTDNYQYLNPEKRGEDLTVIFPFHEKENVSVAEKLLRKDVRKP